MEITGGNVNIGVGNLSIGNAKGNSIATNTEVAIYGGEGGDSILQLLADNADNTADYFAMRQLASGNFTMGHHTGGGFNDALVIAPYFGSGNNIGIGGTPSNQLTVVGDNAIKNISIYTNSDSAVTTDTGARIFTTGDGGSGIYAENGHLVIQGRPAGRDIIFLSGSSATERMRITSGGNATFSADVKVTGSIGVGVDPSSSYVLYGSSSGSVSYTHLRAHET